MDNRLLSEQIQSIEPSELLEMMSGEQYVFVAKDIVRITKTECDKEWVEWLEKTFYPSANWSDFDYEVWKKRKKEIGI